MLYLTTIGDGGKTMGKLTQVSKRTVTRDDELRSAQRLAFERMRESNGSAESSNDFSSAVQDLIDACEAYLSRQ
jgi:hypothetical protein